MGSYELLEWDRGFFGFKVAKVLPTRTTAHELAGIMQAMRADGIRLAYWAADPSDAESQAAASQAGGFLADRKVTYAAAAHAVLPGEVLGGEPVVEEYDGREITPELEGLALQAGVYSRFKVDPMMPAGSFERLYRIWMAASVAREIAEQVYVVRHQETVAGMVTVGVKNGRADIGLIAVDDSLRGKGAGTALVLAARNWGITRGLAQAQVVTQGDNVPACRFYEKCGYRVDKVENIYHLWIEP